MYGHPSLNQSYPEKPKVNNKYFDIEINTSSKTQFSTRREQKACILLTARVDYAHIHARYSIMPRTILP
jgi:hypothetical protein